MSNSGLAATLGDGASNWTAILASLTTASNYGFVRDFAVVWLYLGTMLWYGCITSSHYSWEHCGGPSSKSVFVFYHDAFEVDVYSRSDSPYLGSPPAVPTSGRGTSLPISSCSSSSLRFSFRSLSTSGTSGRAFPGAFDFVFVVSTGKPFVADALFRVNCLYRGVRTCLPGARSTPSLAIVTHMSCSLKVP